jgi:hypothetical protein
MAAGFKREIVPNVVAPERTTQRLEVFLKFLQCEIPASPALPDYTPSTGKEAGFDGSVQTAGLRKSLRKVRVELIDPVRGDVLLSTFTDHAGAFWFIDVPPGRYTVKTTRQGYNPGVLSDVWLVSG